MGVASLGMLQQRPSVPERKKELRWVEGEGIIFVIPARSYVYTRLSFKAVFVYLVVCRNLFFIA